MLDTEYYGLYVVSLPPAPTLTGTEQVAIVPTSAANKCTTQDIANLAASTINAFTIDANHNASADLTLIPTNAGNDNLAIGETSLNANVSGNNNIALGQGNMLGPVTGSSNIAIGASSLTTLTSGNNNIALGTGPLAGNLTGNQNVAIGQNAISSATAISNCVAIGPGAMSGAGNANINVGIGRNALAAVTNIGNVAIGDNAANAITSGSSNIAIGNAPATGLTTGQNNISIGQSTGPQGAAAATIAIGAAAAAATTGNGNVAVGLSSLPSVTSGSDNIGIGTSAGNLAATGSNNVAIGNGSGPQTDATDTVAIGAFAQPVSSNQGWIGDNSTHAIVLGWGGSTAPNPATDVPARFAFQWWDFSVSTVTWNVTAADASGVVFTSTLAIGFTSAAPALTATPVFTSYYGGNTNALGDPSAWLTIVVNGTTYRIPLYAA
jgi:hypothetical protein